MFFSFVLFVWGKKRGGGALALFSESTKYYEQVATNVWMGNTSP